ncbi:MAG: hypothetical protein P1P88_18295, partial [Bacteroidales bacterium]|nr:hypothetical protein [Bacteroidales bacterium]
MGNRIIYLFIILALCLNASMIQAQQVVDAEYFFDTDPGIGNGTTISFTVADTATFTTSLSIAGLSKGFHKIYIRFKDDNEKWSLYEGHTFYIEPEFTATSASQLVAAEYFFDTDPGIGNGTSIDFSPDDTVNITTNVSIAGLTKGFHKLFVRYKDDISKWSLYEGRTFYVEKENADVKATEVVAMEYFVDEDPGQGNGIPYSITSGATLDMVFEEAMTGLPIGNHTISIRVKDDLGNWSITEGRNIEIAHCTQPVPDFSMAPACTDSAVLITDLSTDVDAGASYEWDIDKDGSVDYTTT